jgi:hypothetical protein
MKLYHALIAGLVASSFVLAEEAATTAPAAAPAEKTAPAAKPAAKKEGVKNISGTIVAVDAIANTVIIKTKVKKVEALDTLTVNDKTVIKAEGKVIALADLKADTKVSAAYKSEDGKKVATKIAEKGEKAGAAPKAKAKDTTAAAPAPAPAPATTK